MTQLSATSTLLAVVFFFSFIASITADCSGDTPAFPSPDYGQKSAELLEAFNDISNALTTLVSKPEYDTSSYSIEITSTDSTLWSTFHTAEDKNSSRPGAKEVNGQSAYRIASITKTFTVLGLLYQDAAGNLSLDDTVDIYVPDLVKGHQNGTIPWKDITLRTLASQLSGIPRDFAQGDLVAEFKDFDLVQYGFPPVSPAGLPTCDSFANYTPCTEKDFIDWLRSTTARPVFAPKQKSTYSNLAFNLLGLVLANVTGLSYEEYIQTAILEPLGMIGSSFLKPSDSVAVLPKDELWYWDVDEGVENPTGGLFATSSDMSKFLRYILTHFNGITPALNWFQPASFAEGVNSFYGVPWEIFRTDKILPGVHRPVTFVTKGGGLPGYSTNILLVPEYSLGITILTAGNGQLLSKAREIVTINLIRAADRFAQRQAREKYAGTYSSHHINSTFSIAVSPYQGLYISQFVSNGTDTLSWLLDYGHLNDLDITLQLIPTLLYRDERQKRGELFRAVLNVSQRQAPRELWDDFCTTDVDTLMYAGKPLGEVIFWDTDETGHRYDRIELSAFRVWLDRVTSGKEADSVAEERLVQEL
jgi:CubicO group peptidase (beta-lactamase class C family)